MVKPQLKIGHEDINNLMFTGQRVKWTIDEKTKKKSHTVVEESLCVSELTEVKGLQDDEKCDNELHTAYRSFVGSIKWLQSCAQFRSCYQFSRCASAARLAKRLGTNYVDKLLWSLCFGQCKVLPG